ncbi:MAG: glycosyltransferase family 1 protein [Acidobacteriota bacterium]
MALRVGIDTRSLRCGPAGVATYVRNLLRHLPYLECLDHTLPANNFLWNQIWGPLAQIRGRWQIFHAPAYTAPLLNLSKLALAVHDVSYLAGGDLYPYRVDRFRLAFYRASLRAADLILVPSRFSGEELGRRFPALVRRIRQVPLGVSGEFIPDPDAARAARVALELPHRFLLNVGDLHPRRNLPLLAAAARQHGLPLVLVGRRLAGPGPEGPEVLRYEGLPTEQLRGVYSAAEAFVYASVYEGFGLPLLEAMACGIPVIAVRRASIPEVCGEAAVLVEPDLRSLVEGIQTALDRRHEYIEAGREWARRFSWKRTAQQTEAAYRELVQDIRPRLSG